MNEKLKNISVIFENWAKEKPLSITLLPASGSNREYYRITGNTHICLGVYNVDRKENTAFISFTNHFLQHHLPVPEVYAQDLSNHIYLIEDLGDETLFSFLQKNKDNNPFSDNTIRLYEKVIQNLIQFQINGGKDLDYSLCYPRAAFDKQSMEWDLNYFKYYFLRLAKIPFDEQALEDDFQSLISYLLQAGCDYFLYRDFQSRNIMLQNGEIYFIDYQGGRKGALQYDLASLLYDAKAEIPQSVREQLLDYYIQQLKMYIPVDETSFKAYFYGYVFIRIMQAMGTYGFRGFYEKKAHFLQSIPPALANIEYLLKQAELPIKIPSLLQALQLLVESEELHKIAQEQTVLTISINSFSYRRNIPEDESGNGGGFVFDCRALPNPGRYDEYKQLTGKNKEVIEFLHKESEVTTFLNTVEALVCQSVDVYRNRKFQNLMVNFGCTGGQHRSVFCAENLSKRLQKRYPDVKVLVRHMEQE